MAKRSPKGPESLKSAFEPNAWEKFESLMKVASTVGHRPPEETMPTPKKDLRSAPPEEEDPAEAKNATDDDTTIERAPAPLEVVAPASAVAIGELGRPGMGRPVRSDDRCYPAIGAVQSST